MSLELTQIIKKNRIEASGIQNRYIVSKSYNLNSISNLMDFFFKNKFSEESFCTFWTHNSCQFLYK